MSTSSITPNDLETISFIAGTEQELTFYIYTSGSVSKDLSGATCTWKMSRYGSETALLTKTASVPGSPNNKMIVTLTSSDTASLSGKFIHQPVITEGASDYIPSQGIINIFGKIS